MNIFDLLGKLPTITIKFRNNEFTNAHASLEIISGAIWLFYGTEHVRTLIYEGITSEEDLVILIESFLEDMAKKNTTVCRVNSIWINGVKIE